METKQHEQPQLNAYYFLIVSVYQVFLFVWSVTIYLVIAY